MKIWEYSETGYFQEEIQDQEKGFSVSGSGNVGKSITRRRWMPIKYFFLKLVESQFKAKDFCVSLF